MSRPQLRPTVEDDLPAIADLTAEVFGRRRSVELLRWLLLDHPGADPSAPPGADPGFEIESKVIEGKGRLDGHAAVLRCRYRWRGETPVGAHALLWMVAPAARGPAGMTLGAWSGSHGDFSLVVGGTQFSKPILKRRRFLPLETALEVRLPTSSAAGGDVDTGIEDLELAPFGGEPAAEPGDGAPLVNLAAASQLRWLAACPELEGHLFTLRRAGEALGPVHLFINRHTSPPGGRIVHLPWLSGDRRPALRLSLAELAGAGCESASLLVTGPELLAAARDLGGEVFYERPVWYRDAAGIGEPTALHLSYLEGDLAYRNV